MSNTSVESTPSARATSTELKAKLGSVFIDETPEEERKPVALVDRMKPARYSNQLTPPVGTSYWRLQSFVPMNSFDLTYWHVSERIIETLTWRVDAYVYVVNARPDDDFQKNGGAVYVVLVHGGAATTGNSVGPGIEYRYTVSLKHHSGFAMKQLPHSNSGVQSGDVLQYPISFSQDMQMFRNNGNESFTFQAGYEDSIEIRNGHQIGYVESTSSVRWGVVFDTPPDFRANFPFGALSLFKVDSLALVTFDCIASAHDPDGSLKTSHTQSITVNCQFSP